MTRPVKYQLPAGCHIAAVGTVTAAEEDTDGVWFDLPNTDRRVYFPRDVLTPVDTTPPEPEPGAWLIGETLCVRWEGDDSERHWSVPAANVVGGFVWLDWHMAWEKLGGSGITPRRLVPAPTVALPAEAKSHYQNTVIVDHYDGATVSMTLPKRLTEWFDADNAEILGNAFLAAARAARGATP